MPKILGDFRPISLLGDSIKLLEKVLVNKLKKVVGRWLQTRKKLLMREDKFFMLFLLLTRLLAQTKKL